MQSKEEGNQNVFKYINFNKADESSIQEYWTDSVPEQRRPVPGRIILGSVNQERI